MVEFELLGSDPSDIRSKTGLTRTDAKLIADKINSLPLHIELTLRGVRCFSLIGSR